MGKWCLVGSDRAYFGEPSLSCRDSALFDRITYASHHVRPRCEETNSTLLYICLDPYVPSLGLSEVVLLALAMAIHHIYVDIAGCYLSTCNSGAIQTRSE